MKAAVIGAGSTYTPELVAGLLAQQHRIGVETLTLVDVDERRLGILAGFVRRMAPGLQVEATTELAEGVRDARLVFSQFRVGGQAARDTDEELGRRWGIVGQETTGVGGLAKGLRTIPAALAVQAAVAAHAAPDAWLVNFTNPAGMVTEALLAHGTGDPPRVVGLCNFPWVLRERLAAGLGVTTDSIDLDYVGLNHLAWVREVRVDGDPQLAAAREVWRAGPDAPFADQLLDDLGLILNPYLQYYYETERILAGQRTTPTRASVVARDRGRAPGSVRRPDDGVGPRSCSPAGAGRRTRSLPPAWPPTSSTPTRSRPAGTWSTSSTVAPCRGCPTTPWWRPPAWSTPPEPWPSRPAS